MADSNESVEPVVMMAARLRRDGTLAAGECVELVLSIARQVAALHAAGRLHRAIDLAAIQFDGQDRPRLSPLTESLEFGGPYADSETCPPELQNQSPISISQSIHEARHELEKFTISMPPQRIDVYQLGVLMCQLLTGENIRSYLHSPTVKRLVPQRLQIIIDAALGYDPSERNQTVDELIRSLELISSNPTDDGDTDRHLVGNDRDTDLVRIQEADSSSQDSRERIPASIASDTMLPFQRLGHYEILDRIGHGGMGDVYKGYERALDRVVAIKVLPAEFARQPEFVNRFRAEAAAVASLTHPNVIQIHFIGEDQGHHFFAMQYVEGESLAQRLQRRGHLDVDESMSILEQVLAGLTAAHRRGIVHRDIKPANVLLDRVNRRALVADFGLVKSIGGADKMTATGVVMGTVDYLSPEQARGLPVDARSDLYSVGVLAYQLLSGRLPFEADSATAMIFQHVYEQPKSLRQLVANVPASLCAIVEKLLQKSPDQRYQTAEEVLADFAKIRAGKTLESEIGEVRASVSERRGHTAIIAAPQFDIPLLPEDFDRDAPLGWWQRIRQQWADRLRRRQPAFIKRLQNTQQQVDGALAEYEHRRRTLQELVDEAESVLNDLRRSEADYREAAESAENRAAESSDKRMAEEAQQERIACLRCADELAIPIAEQQSQLESMQLKLAQIRATLDKVRNQRDLLNARLNVAQARTALAAERPKRTATKKAIGALAVLGTVTAAIWLAIHYRRPAATTTVPETPKTYPKMAIGAVGERILQSPGEVRCLAMAPTRIEVHPFVFATGNMDGTVDLFNSVAVKSINPPTKLTSHLQKINALAFSPDGKLFAAAANDGAISIWETHAGKRSRELRRLEGHNSPVTGVRFSPDSKQLLSGDQSGALRLWDISRAQEIHSTSLEVADWINAMDWSRDGRHVLIALRLNGGKSMKMVNLYDNQDQIIFDTNKERTDAVAFSHSEDQAFSLRNHAIFVNDIRTQKIVKQFGGKIVAAAFSPDANRVWTADQDHNLALWDIRSGTIVEAFSGHGDIIDAVSISADGSEGISASRDGTIRLWELSPAPPPANQLQRLACDGPILSVAFSPDGFSALAGTQNDATLWELDTGTVVRTYGLKTAIPSVGFASDGQSIIYAAGGQDANLGYVGVRNLNELLGDKRQFEGHVGRIASVALSPDMRHAVSGGVDGTVRVWNVETGEPAEQLNVAEHINALEFTKTGDAVLIGSDGNSLRIWKWNSTKEVSQLEGHTFRILDVAISRDGTRAATASGDRTIRIWDLATSQLVSKLEGHSAAVNSVSLSEHGLIALTGSSDGSVRLWDVAKAKEIERFEGHIGEVRSVALSRDGTRALSGGDDAQLRIWKLPPFVQ